MTFVERAVHHHNAGFEFDIVHPRRGVSRFAAPTEIIREDWAELCYYRCEPDEKSKIVQKGMRNDDENISPQKITRGSVTNKADFMTPITVGQTVNDVILSGTKILLPHEIDEDGENDEYHDEFDDDLDSLPVPPPPDGNHNNSRGRRQSLTNSGRAFAAPQDNHNGPISMSRQTSGRQSLMDENNNNNNNNAFIKKTSIIKRKPNKSVSNDNNILSLSDNNMNNAWIEQEDGDISKNYVSRNSIVSHRNSKSRTPFQDVESLPGNNDSAISLAGGIEAVSIVGSSSDRKKSLSQRQSHLHQHMRQNFPGNKSINKSIGSPNHQNHKGHNLGRRIPIPVDTTDNLNSNSNNNNFGSPDSAMNDDDKQTVVSALTDRHSMMHDAESDSDNDDDSAPPSEDNEEDETLPPSISEDNESSPPYDFDEDEQKDSLRRVGEEQLKRARSRSILMVKQAEDLLKFKDSKYLYQIRMEEAKNPMTLSDLVRYFVFFSNETMAVDADETAGLALPHTFGQSTNFIFTTLYSHYAATESGYMGFTELVKFVEDSEILKTHTPLDGSDTPLQKNIDELSPASLLAHVPAKMGYSKDMMTDFAEKAIGEGKSEVHINFAQFHYIALKMTEVAYPQLFHKDAVAAFDKVLREVFLPLFVWSQGHYKQGSIDPLLSDARVALLAHIYAPNLWKVFCYYSVDLNNRSPTLNVPYPEGAKVAERAFFGIPHGAPFLSTETDKVKLESRKHLQKGRDDGFDVTHGLLITEKDFMKFCNDYGITHHLLSKNEIKTIFKEMNRGKSISTSSLQGIDTKSKVAAKIKSLSSNTRDRLGKNLQDNKVIQKKKFHFRNSTNVSPVKTTDKVQIPTPLPAIHGGLSFSEFLEALGHISTRGLKSKHYTTLFPTPYLKYFGIMTVFGVADLNKLKDVRALNTLLADEMV